MDFPSRRVRTRLTRLCEIYNRRVAWTMCSIVSVLSSRHLLVELNVHFPSHLYLIQLGTMGLLVTVLHLLRRGDSPVPPPSTSGWLLPIAIAAVTAASTIFSLQAILHFLNLPTLAMLAATSYCAESWILIGSAQSPRSRLDIVRIAIATCGCVGILLAEYRLLVAALLTAIPAVLLGGLARAMRSIAATHPHSLVFDSRRMNMLLFCTGFGITAICVAYQTEETWDRFFYALNLKDVPLLVVNALTTAVAMILGQSVLIPVDSVTTDAGGVRSDDCFGNMLTLLTTAGAIGLSSTFMLRRSYTAWPQLGFFALAVGCLVDTAAIENFRNRWRHYSAVVDTSGLPTRENEDTVLSELSNATQVADTIEYRRHSFNPLLLLVALLTVWVPFLALNFSPRIHQNKVDVLPMLDLEYTPKGAPVDIIISMYREPVEEVARLVGTLRAMPNLRDSRVHIYVKDPEANTKRIQHGTGANDITKLPNIGREGETYLYHILRNWNSLAKHTVFLQADVHNPREFYPRIRDYFDPTRTGMLSLGWSGQVCNCNDCGDRFNFWDTTHLFPHTQALINNTTKCDKVLLTYKGQFIVSARRIRGIDKSIYHDLRQAFVDKNSWAHSEEYLQGRPDSMSAPVFGYTMERMWNLLFQCNDMQVAWKCATLLSGNRIGGSIADCQCFDPVNYNGFRKQLDLQA